jgi:hypothetical protein
MPKVIILLNGHAFFWGLAGSTLTALKLSADSEIMQSMSFTFILSVFSTLVDLPFTIYYTFWLEERHGFNKQVKIKHKFQWQVFMWISFIAIRRPDSLLKTTLKSLSFLK